MRARKNPDENRGGARVGTPGETYGNRTDLNVVHAPSGEMAADGNVLTSASAGQMAPPMEAPMRGPDDSPMLLSPSQRPDERLSAGLSSTPAMGMQAPPRTSLADTLEMLSRYDNSGEIQQLAFNARVRGW